jgi:exodeoxyribonuclease-1
MRVVRAAAAEELGSLDLQFEDPRLKMLLPLYKARNYPQAMTSDEHQVWDQFRAKRLLGDGVQSRMAVFFSKLQEIADRKSLTQEQSYLVEELRLYGETIMPI